MRVTDMKTKNGTVAMQWFLSPEGKMFRGRKSTLEHITKCGKYNVEDIRKFRCSGDTPTKSPYEWNDSDPSVPNGWKTTMITVKHPPAPPLMFETHHKLLSGEQLWKECVEQEISQPRREVLFLQSGLLEIHAEGEHLPGGGHHGDEGRSEE